MKLQSAGLRVEFPEGLMAVANLLDGGLAVSGGLKRPRFWAYGLTVVTALLLVWVVLAPIERVVRGDGKVIPSGKNRVVQHLEGGVVSKIHVKEGDLVRVGQTLVDISAVEADSELKERGIKLAGLRAKAARLLAEAQGTEMPVDAAHDADSAAWTMERQTLIGRKAKLQQAQSVYLEQSSQRQAEISELAARARNLRDELATARRQQETHETLLQRRAGSELDVLDAKSRVQRLITQLSEVEQRVPQLNAAVREINSKMQADVGAMRSEARTELALVTTEAKAIEEEMRHRGERLRRTVISSPVEGQVNRVFVTSEGTVVRPGDPVVEVTPVTGELVIEAQVEPRDRAELRHGLAAVVKLGPYDYTLHGALNAIVDDISADALADDKGRTFYRLRLRVAAEEVAKFGKAIVPGMPLTADVVLSQRTVGSYITSSVLRFGSTAFRDAR